MKNDNSITLPRYFVLALVFMMVVPLLTACSTVALVSHGANLAVSQYCSKAPGAARSVIRKAVNKSLAPNSIAITCAED
jgi:hypothetical protein